MLLGIKFKDFRPCKYLLYGYILECHIILLLPCKDMKRRKSSGPRPPLNSHINNTTIPHTPYTSSASVIAFTASLLRVVHQLPLLLHPIYNHLQHCCALAKCPCESGAHVRAPLIGLHAICLCLYLAKNGRQKRIPTNGMLSAPP